MTETHRDKARFLADRLRWLNESRVISLRQAEEICSKLGEIIFFLDQLAAQPEYLSGCQLRGPGECQSRGMCQSMACVHRGKVIVKRVCVEAQVDGIVYPKVGT